MQYLQYQSKDGAINIAVSRDGQNHHMLMILKSKSNHLNIKVI